MTRDEGRGWCDRPITVGGVQVRVANTRRLDLHEDLALANLRHRDFIDR
jgi:hypothetical protein